MKSDNTENDSKVKTPYYSVKRPLAVKLIAIVSFIVLVSMGTITALAAWYFGEDTLARTEEQNFTLNELVAHQMESEVQSLYSGSMTLLDTIRESGGDPAFETASVGSYFERNTRMIYIGVAGEKDIYNDRFFSTWELEKSAIHALMESRAEFIARAKAGESLLVNASPWVGVPSAVLLAPYKDLGRDDVLAVLFSTEALQESVKGDSINQTYAIAQDGEAIAHSDFELLRLGVNMNDSEIVEDCIASSRDSMQLRFTARDRGEYLGSFRKIPVGQFAVITTVPVNTIYSVAEDVVRQCAYVIGIALLFSILAVWFFSKTVSAPLLTLVRASREIDAGNYDIDVESASGDEIGLLNESFASMARSLADRERIKETFGKSVSREIAEQALVGNLSLDGSRKTATIMFADIRSFTAISEHLAPEAVVEFLNGYMTRMVACIEKTHGVVDKFIGDAIMAVWGAPFSRGSPQADAFNCIYAMILMRKSLYEFNKDRGGPEKPVIRIGCGVDTGACLAGQIGSAKRMEYTVIGDAVKIANCIESLNKPFATDILISSNTYELVKDRVVVEAMPSITVKGKTEPLQIYSVINVRGVKGPRTLADIRSLFGIKPPEGIVKTDQEEVKYEILGK